MRRSLAVAVLIEATLPSCLRVLRGSPPFLIAHRPAHRRAPLTFLLCKAQSASREKKRQRAQ